MPVVCDVPGMSGTPAYKAWCSVLNRGHRKEFRSRFPTYEGVIVCQEWLSFKAFKTWYEEHYREGCHLDKDLLSGKIYSPSTCVYIPAEINTLIGKFDVYSETIGTCSNSPGKWIARLSVRGTKKNLGTYSVQREASNAYKRAWVNNLNQLIKAYKHDLHPDAVEALEAYLRNVVQIVKKEF